MYGERPSDLGCHQSRPSVAAKGDLGDTQPTQSRQTPRRSSKRIGPNRNAVRRVLPASEQGHTRHVIGETGVLEPLGHCDDRRLTDDSQANRLLQYRARSSREATVDHQVQGQGAHCFEKVADTHDTMSGSPPAENGAEIRVLDSGPSRHALEARHQHSQGAAVSHNHDSIAGFADVDGERVRSAIECLEARVGRVRRRVATGPVTHDARPHASSSPRHPERERST